MTNSPTDTSHEYISVKKIRKRRRVISDAVFQVFFAKICFREDFIGDWDVTMKDIPPNTPLECISVRKFGSGSVSFRCCVPNICFAMVCFRPVSFIRETEMSP